MPRAHPFDNELTRIDPQARRVTVTDVRLLEEGEFLNATVVAMIPTIMVIDFRLFRADHGRVRLELPPRLAGLPISMAGIGVGSDGCMGARALGIKPCGCQSGKFGGNHWNPLALALMWHETLPQRLTKIAAGFKRNIAANKSHYCRDGLALLESTDPMENAQNLLGGNPIPPTGQ